MNHGLFLISRVALIDPSAVVILVSDISNLFLASAASVCCIAAKRNEPKEINKKLPLVFSRLLAAFVHEEFCSTVAIQRKRIVPCRTVARHLTPIELHEQWYRQT